MPAPKPRGDSTIFTLKADDLDEAVVAAVEHLQGLAEAEDLRGFEVPVLTREAFERIDGVWTRTFRFRAELIPAVE